MRILSLDVGEKRIGVARADTSTKIAIPVETINVDGNEFEEIARLSRLYSTNFLVLGLPRSNEGNETAQTVYVRNFARSLTEKHPEFKIRFQDESLTSVEAESRLKARKKSFEKGEIDAEAAAIILQDFIESFQEKGSEAKTTTMLQRNADKAKLNSKKVLNESKKLVDESKKIVEVPKKIVKKTKRKIMRKLFIIIPILLVLGLGTLGAFLWYQDSLKPVVSECPINGCEDIEFVINEGDPKEVIVNHLADQKLIKNAFTYKIFLKFNYKDETFKSGTYNLRQNMDAAEIAQTLINGSRSSDVFSFTIRPGETIFDVQKNLIKAGFSEDEVYSTFTTPITGRAFKPNDASVEGYLYGETYEFYKGSTVKQILERFLSGMERVIEENNLREKYAAQGLSLHEGIILASIVQKEAAPADQATVAQVFLKRLRSGTPLGSDVTVSYAVDTVDINRVFYDNNASALDIDSCYNTRRNVGLPCGAISSPSLSALLAVANPTDTDYFYFLTGDDGKMYYSYTEAEHNQNIYDHCKVLCNVSL